MLDRNCLKNKYLEAKLYSSEQILLDVISKLHQKIFLIEHAAQILDVSERTVLKYLNDLIIKWRAIGEAR